IRDPLVTGVQTCALPIYFANGILCFSDLPSGTVVGYHTLSETHPREHAANERVPFPHLPENIQCLAVNQTKVTHVWRNVYGRERSEERRVGKGWRGRGGG